jgi:hypothetical protein
MTSLPVALGVLQGQFGNALTALGAGCTRLAYLGFFVLYSSLIGCYFAGDEDENS